MSDDHKPIESDDGGLLITREEFARAHASWLREFTDAAVKAALDAERARSLRGRRTIPMLLVCPACCQRHIDEGEFATKEHHTHACQFCGMVWRPALGPTVGVQFLPGFKNESGAP